ncbi:MAG: superoxide dismutase [Nitrospiraceae bacterium]|nr:superoxide dismutase [Nitrospiraceae bacterium]
MNEKHLSGLSRREFLSAAAVTVAAGVIGAPSILHGAVKHELPKLPYAENALEPVISAKTMSFHYGKHHKAYVDNLNKLTANTEYADMSLERIIKATAGKPDKAGIFNNAAQVWNHSFYWNSLKPKGGGKPKGKLMAAIESSFGNFDKFAAEFSNAAVTQFGSGWAWLVKDDGKLKITKTSNAETPLIQGIMPLLTIDVWEHAYYLDYQNRRPDYVAAVINKLMNWSFAEDHLG